MLYSGLVFKPYLAQRYWRAGLIEPLEFCVNVGIYDANGSDKTFEGHWTSACESEEDSEGDPEDDWYGHDA